MERPEWLPDAVDGWHDSPDHRGGFRVKGPVVKTKHLGIVVSKSWLRAYQDKVSISGPFGTLHRPCSTVAEFYMAASAVGLTEWLPQVPDAPGWWWREGVPTRVFSRSCGDLAYAVGSSVAVVGNDGAWDGPCLGGE